MHPRLGHPLLLAVVVGLFAVGQAAAAVSAVAPATRLAESEPPPGEGEEKDCQESASVPSAPRAVRPPSAIPGPHRVRSGWRRGLSSIPGTRGRPLAVSGLPPALPLRC